MTRDEAVAEMKQLMRFRQNLDAQCRSGLINAQRYYEEGPVEPWFLRSERSHTFTQANEERVPLPNNFLRETEESALWYVPDDGSADVELSKQFIDTLRRAFPTNAPERPTHYAIDARYFRLFPKPDAVYKIRMIYMKKDEALASNIENLWLKHAPWLLIGRAGRILSAGTGDTMAKTEFEGHEASGLASLTSKSEAREYDNRRLQMGGPHA